jgi:integrase
MRYSEIRLLTWNQIDLIGATLTVGASKTDAGSGRKIPLNARALKALQAWATGFPKRKGQHYVFPTEGIGLATNDEVVVAHHTEPTEPIGSVQHAWQRAKKAAGVTIRFHDLRHSACTHLLEAVVPLMVVGQLLGLAGGTVAAMAKKYGHVGPKALQDAVKPLEPKRTRKRKPTAQPTTALVSATVN